MFRQLRVNKEKLLYSAVMIGFMAWYALQSVHADVLLLESIENQSQLIGPEKGWTASQVTTRYGQPQEKIAAVGTPPISRWVYEEFTVYFESQTVIHAVRNRD